MLLIGESSVHNTIVSHTAFTWDGFSQTLHDIMPWTIYMGVFSLAIEIVAAIYQ